MILFQCEYSDSDTAVFPVKAVSTVEEVAQGQKVINHWNIQ